MLIENTLMKITLHFKNIYIYHEKALILFQHDEIQEGNCVNL